MNLEYITEEIVNLEDMLLRIERNNSLDSQLCCAKMCTYFYFSRLIFHNEVTIPRKFHSERSI